MSADLTNILVKPRFVWLNVELAKTQIFSSNLGSTTRYFFISNWLISNSTENTEYLTTLTNFDE